VRVIRFGELEHRADSGAAGREHLQVHFGLAPVVPVVMGDAGRNEHRERRRLVYVLSSLIVTSPSVTKYSWSTGWVWFWGPRVPGGTTSGDQGAGLAAVKDLALVTPFRRVFPRSRSRSA